MNPSHKFYGILHYLRRQVIDSHSINYVKCKHYHMSNAWKRYCTIVTFQWIWCCFSSKSIWDIVTCTIYLHIIIVLRMVAASHGETTEANFVLGPPDVSLNCISISSRSSVECALRASVMDLYENQFAYLDGQCHVCRPDNANCAVSEDEYLVAGPHHVRGGFLVYLIKYIQGLSGLYFVVVIS